MPGAYGRFPYVRMPCALPGWGRESHVRMCLHKGREARVQPSAITQPPTLLGHPGGTATGHLAFDVVMNDTYDVDITVTHADTRSAAGRRWL
ncbi:hypothetical protein HEK616_28400 [Streptomyces nigrescens]|uniref:Uncharacterized protein n=1 Tax=Streptomyces nigrescens TaxID=1920 RepID=A0ABN6QYC9_STRNI|nr:hypothetical protein HEK616_28400 [Streptomyces nigrescens]